MMPANEFARRYLEDLLSFFGLNTSVEDQLVDSTVELMVPSSRLNGFLIGQRGQNLQSMQHLTNMAVRRGGYEDVTVVIDVAGYKKQRYERLARQAQGIAEEVLASGQDRELEPMNPAERRVVHQAIGEIEGLSSDSSGEGRDRHIVIKKTDSS